MSTSQAHRFLDRHGQDVTLTTYADSGSTDKQGDTVWDESTSTIKARVDIQTDPRLLTSAAGEEAVVEADIFVKDTVDVQDSGDAKASKVTADGVDYVVVIAGDQGNGLKRLQCERMR